MPELDEKSLLELLRDTDPQRREAAFSVLTGRFSKRIYWTVRKIVVSHHDADDVVQNVFLKVWGSIGGFRGESGLFTWLYRIAVNESLSLIRSRRSGLFTSLDDPGTQFDRIVESEGLFDGDAVERALARAVNRLPAKQRTVFSLRYWDEMPYEQMAGVLDTSVGALKASYHHAAAKVEGWVQREAVGGFFRVEHDPLDPENPAGEGFPSSWDPNGGNSPGKKK